jgi:hypothetical protein
MAINLAYLRLVAPKASDRLNSIGLHHNKLLKPTRDRRACVRLLAASPTRAPCTD